MVGYKPGDDMYNERLIRRHDHELWKHCKVESPQMCPRPSCPPEPLSVPTTSRTPTLTETEAGAASTHHMNLILFITVSLLHILF